MPELYDVILFGVRGKGEEREVALRAVAQLLKLEPEAIESGLSQANGMVIRSSVTEQVARKYQSALAKLGGLGRIQLAPQGGGVSPQGGGARSASSPPVPANCAGAASGSIASPAKRLD